MKTLCPICAAAPAPDFDPFCSRGCKDRDLLQWLGEGYRLPGRPVDHDAPGTGLDSPPEAD